METGPRQENGSDQESRAPLRFHRSKALGLLLHRGRPRADPGFGPGFGIAAADQVYEFLRRRHIAAVAALLRHRTANPGPLGFHGSRWVNPGRGGVITRGQTFDDRLSELAANMDVAFAHDWNPF